MRIKLVKPTKCARDMHEQINYPRKGFVAKPELPAGTILNVDSKWSNFFGSYYSCGNYDIPVENAKVID